MGPEPGGKQENQGINPSQHGNDGGAKPHEAPDIVPNLLLFFIPQLKPVVPTLPAATFLLSAPSYVRAVSALPGTFRLFQ
jgi:hypothetical protein